MGRGSERERIPCSLKAVSIELDTGLEPMNREMSQNQESSQSLKQLSDPGANPYQFPSVPHPLPDFFSPAVPAHYC